MAKKALPKTWTMRDKTVVQIAKMETSHIQNVIAMMLRKARRLRVAETLGSLVCTSFTNMPDGVFDAVMDEAHALDCMTDDEFMREKSPVYLAMCHELAKRKQPHKAEVTTSAPLKDRIAELELLWSDPLVQKVVRFITLKKQLDSELDAEQSKRIWEEINRDRVWGDN